MPAPALLWFIRLQLSRVRFTHQKHAGVVRGTHPTLSRLKWIPPFVYLDAMQRVIKD